MLIPKEVISRIDEIVERAYIDFTFDLLGEDFLTDEQKTMVESLGLIIGRKPLIELLYTLVRQRSSENYLTNRRLNDLLEEIIQTGVLPELPDAQQASVDNAKQKVSNHLEKTKSTIKTEIKEVILEQNEQFRQERLTDPVPSIPVAQRQESKYEGLIIAGITGALAGLTAAFVRDMTTTTTDIVNNAVLDSVASGSTPESVPGTPQLVYKKVVSDGSLCVYCNGFYTERDGTPKVYTLSELQAGGSNYGKPKSQWNPTLTATHPRCRCQLLHLPPRYLFKKGSSNLERVSLEEWNAAVRNNKFSK